MLLGKTRLALVGLLVLVVVGAALWILAAPLLPFFVSLPPPARFESTHFYVVAHQDDWQLFMNPSAFEDAQRSDAKVVFIYLTAGDDGCGSGCLLGAARTPYYLARENGANLGVRFIATSGPDARHHGRGRSRGHHAGPYGEAAYAKVRINNRWFDPIQYLNTVSYFFRLPDGSPSGKGYSTTGYQSLARLHSGEIAEIKDILGNNQYKGWSDLVETLRQILLREAAGSPTVTVNVPNPDTSINMGDHSDHTYTGQAMLDAIVSHSCVSQRKFLDYVTGGMPLNLSAENTVKEAAAWGATVSGLIDSGAETPFNTGHNRFIGKNYYTETSGTGPCDFR